MNHTEHTDIHTYIHAQTYDTIVNSEASICFNKRSNSGTLFLYRPLIYQREKVKSKFALTMHLIQRKHLLQNIYLEEMLLITLAGGW